MTERTAPSPAATVRRVLKGLPGVGFILIGMVVIFAIGNPRFLSGANLVNVGLQASLLMMLALPMTLIILTEGLGVPGTFAVMRVIGL